MYADSTCALAMIHFCTKLGQFCNYESRSAVYFSARSPFCNTCTPLLLLLLLLHHHTHTCASCRTKIVLNSNSINRRHRSRFLSNIIQPINHLKRPQIITPKNRTTICIYSFGWILCKSRLDNLQCSTWKNGAHT